MKFLKISDDTHNNLKKYCNNYSFSMKDWVEYVVDENIKKFNKHESADYK